MSDKNNEPDIIEGEFTERRQETAGAESAGAKTATRLPWVVAGILLIFVAGIFTAPWAETGLYRIAPGLFPKQEKEPAAPAIDTGRIDRLEQRLVQIEQTLDVIGSASGAQDVSADIAGIAARLDALETTPAPSGPADLTAVDAKLAEFDQRIAAIASAESAPVAGPDSEIIGRLEARLALIEASRRSDWQQGQFALALSALERRLEKGEPFSAELNTIRTFGETDRTDFSILENHAPTGVPAIDTLLDRYPAAARSALIAENNSDTGWLSRTFSRLKGVVTVRRVGDIEGGDPEAILSRAEIHLQKGDLAAALTELAALPEKNKAAMRQWLEDAGMRLQAEQALAALWRQVEKGAVQE